MAATHRGSAPRPGAAVILDQLDMLVTGDPVAELDAALTVATANLRAARSRGATRTAHTLLGWIDHRLDQRNSLTAVADEPRDHTACRGRPGSS